MFLKTTKLSVSFKVLVSNFCLFKIGLCLSACLCVRLHASMCTVLVGVLEARRHYESPLELRGTGDCVLPHIVSVIQTEVLCKSSKFS